MEGIQVDTDRKGVEFASTMEGIQVDTDRKGVEFASQWKVYSR